VEIESWPLSNAGKVDKKVLPMSAERYNERADFAEPGSELEKQLAVIWQKKLNLEQIGIDDNFFDLGGSSLAAVGTIGQINNELGFNLNLTILYQLPTIRQLANKIETKDIFDIDPIILLKEGTGTPLFIFPQWGSYPTAFNEFVKTYQGNNPLYGIIYPQDHQDFPYKSLQEYAKFIIGHIKKLYPQGPYSLLGYSIGVRIIFEVAVQLQQVGIQLDMVAAVSDSPPLPLKRLFLSREVRDAIMVLRKIEPGLKLKYLHRRLPRLIELVVKGKQDPPPVQLEVLTQSRISAIQREYGTKQKYKGELLLIHEPSPTQGKPHEFQQPEVYRYSILPKLWYKYIDGNIVQKIMHVGHSDFLKQPAVTELTNVVHNYLKGNKL
jgi:thioesterase domain-containing protein/acyl carrier protein